MINYTGYVGIQTPTSLPELVNGREYMTLSNEARNARGGVAIPYTDEAFMKYDSKTSRTIIQTLIGLMQFIKKTCNPTKS